MMVEVKSKDIAFDKNIVYFNKKYGVPGRQICPDLQKPRQIKGREVFLEDMESFLLSLDPFQNPPGPIREPVES